MANEASNVDKESGSSGPTVTGRGRKAGGAWLVVMGVAGVGLLIAALFAPEDSNSATATAVAGGILLLLVVVAVSGWRGKRPVAAAGFIVGLLLILSGFVTDEIDFPEWARIIGGASVALTSVGALATMESGSPSKDSPAT